LQRRPISVVVSMSMCQLAADGRQLRVGLQANSASGRDVRCSLTSARCRPQKSLVTGIQIEHIDLLTGSRGREMCDDCCDGIRVIRSAILTIGGDKIAVTTAIRHQRHAFNECRMSRPVEDELSKAL
jgi:hypothetical protein